MQSGWESAWVKSGVVADEGGRLRTRLPGVLADVVGAEVGRVVVPMRVTAWARAVSPVGEGGARVRLQLGVGMPQTPDGGPHAGFVGLLSPGAPVLSGGNGKTAAANGGGGASGGSGAGDGNGGVGGAASGDERRQARQEHAPRRRDLQPGVYGLYSDGSWSSATPRGGWGLVVTRVDPAGDEQRVACYCGPVVTAADARPWLGAAHATNNTAELQGLGEALRYLLHEAEDGVPAVLVSDSEYAIDAMLGSVRGRRNRRMVAEVQRLWREVREGRHVFVRHVHSHARGVTEAGHVWNEEADRLAARGAAGVVWGVGAAWQGYPPPPPPPKRVHALTETERVLRCAHAFGVLNVPVPMGGLLPPARVEVLYAAAAARLASDVYSPRRLHAQSRLWAARTLLRQGAEQRRVRDALVRAGLQPVTRTVRCRVDARALREYRDTAGPEVDVVPTHKTGQSYGLTRRQLIDRLLGCVEQEDKEGMGCTHISYRHSRLGAELVAAGHVTESREYAVQRAPDPFALPRALRRLAFARVGYDLDDAASFPRAKAAVVVPCRAAVRFFLAHRAEIMRQMGAYFFGGSSLTDAERRDRIKALFNSLDMDGTYSAWRVRMGIADGTLPAAAMVVDLGASGRFDFAAYRNAQAVGASWLADRLPAMRAFVVAHLRNERDAKRLEHPERTLASYVFQEAEGVSRQAKVRWAVQQGHTVLNLEHDGVVLAFEPGVGMAQAERDLRRACSHALGYDQPVEHKP